MQRMHIVRPVGRVIFEKRTQCGNRCNNDDNVDFKGSPDHEVDKVPGNVATLVQNVNLVCLDDRSGECTYPYVSSPRQ